MTAHTELLALVRREPEDVIGDALASLVTAGLVLHLTHETSSPAVCR